jgi:hypothetical protein
MAVETPQAPVQGTQTFGGLVRAASGETRTLLASGGITIKGSCLPSPEDATQLKASITVATDEAGTQYSAVALLGGNVTQIDPGDGDVEVMAYDAGCDQPGGPFYQGGLAFSLAKPSGRAMNGVMSCGVGVLAGDAVFSGQVTW